MYPMYIYILYYIYILHISFINTYFVFLIYTSYSVFRVFRNYISFFIILKILLKYFNNYVMNNINMVMNIYMGWVMINRLICQYVYVRIRYIGPLPP